MGIGNRDSEEAICEPLVLFLQFFRETVYFWFKKAGYPWIQGRHFVNIGGNGVPDDNL